MRVFLLVSVIALTVSESLAIPKCPVDDGTSGRDILLPNPADCSTFFYCVNGVPYLIPCPVGQHWSIASNRCDLPQVAKCEVKKALIRDSECPLHNEGYDILLPNPEDCSTYFQCSNGVKILKKCPPGTLWSVSGSRCDHENIAQCAE